MQPFSLRTTSKRVKKRRILRNISRPATQDDEDKPSVFGAAVSDDECDQDDDVPLRRRIVSGVKQVDDISAVESSKKTDVNLHNTRLETDRHAPAVTRNTDGEPRSQIARLMARRRVRSDDTTNFNDEAAQFRADVARCVDVDDDDYDVVTVEKFGARMLAAMGWQPPKIGKENSDNGIPVRRPARLGLGAKLGADGSAPPPPTHSRAGPFAAVLGQTASSTDDVREGKKRRRMEPDNGDEVHGNGMKERIVDDRPIHANAEIEKSRNSYVLGSGSDSTSKSPPCAQPVPPQRSDRESYKR